MYSARVSDALRSGLAMMAERGHHSEAEEDAEMGPAEERSEYRPAQERKWASESCPRAGCPWRQQ